MKKYYCLLIILLIFAFNAGANPLPTPRIINEFMLTPTGWKIETYKPHHPLDGVMICSLTDSAYFRTRAGIDTGYTIFTPESLSKPLYINPQGDQIRLYQEGYVIEQFSFGISSLPLPRYGQSISWSADGYYLDNTPTFGFANDVLNAVGTINILVTDGVLPISSATVTHYYYDKWGFEWPDSRTTNANGIASFTVIAYRYPLTISKKGYISQNVSFQVYPESTLTYTVQLQSIVSVDYRTTSPNIFFVDEPYPNPFNPSTTIRYSLPSASWVRITIYNVFGEIVNKLLDERQNGGWKEVHWNPNVSSGIYFYTIEAVSADGMNKRYKETKKVLLLR